MNLENCKMINKTIEYHWNSVGLQNTKKILRDLADFLREIQGILRFFIGIVTELLRMYKISRYQ